MAGYVCLTFDDGLATQYTNGYPLLAAADIDATVFVVSDLVGSEASYMTAEQLLTLQTAGWEVGSHGKTHTNLTTLSVEDATTEMTASKTALEALGLTITTISYPNGASNAAIRDAAAAIYARQRGITGVSAPQYLRHFTTNVRLVNGTQPQTLSLFQGYIDEAIRTDSVIVLYFHAVEADGTLTGTPYKLQDVLAYILAKQTSNGLQVVTYAGLSGVGTTDAIEWGSADAESASTNAAWVGGAKPTAGKHLIFTNKYLGNCTLDEAVVYGDIQVTEYTGTITHGEGVAIGYRDLHIESAATWTGRYDQYQTFTGNILNTAATITAEGVYLRAAGTCTFYSPALVWLRSLMVNSGATLSINSPIRYTTIFNNAGTINIGTSQYLGHWNTRSGDSFANTGIINGPGAFQVDMELKNLSLTLGTINAPLAVRAPNSANGNRTLTVVDAALSLGSTLDVYSSHGTYTTTLFTSGTRTLAVAGLTTLGARGIMLQGTGAWSFGSYTQSGASSVFTQGGNVTVGNVTASGGTLTGAGSASVTLTSSGDVNLTGATVTADKLNLVMTGAGKSLTAQNILLHSLDISGSVSATVNDWWGITDAGLFHVSGALSLPGTSNVLYAYCPTRIVISGILAGTGALAIVYNNTASGILSRIWNAGISAEIRIRSSDEKVSTLGSNLLTGGKLLVENSGGASMTLDAAGYNIDCSTIVLGTGGILLGGEGVHHLGGNFDSSAGTWTPETCQVVFTKAATVTLAAGQSFYDLLTYAPAVTLASDITVSNILAHVGPIIPGAFALTMTDPTKEYTSMRRPIKRNLRTPIGLPPCCRPLLEGIERVSA